MSSGFDPASSPPLPAPSELTRFYWDAVAAHRLDLLRCRACGHFVHYPRPVCDRCRSQDLGPETVSGAASLYGYSEVVQASHPFFVERAPYLVGVVEIDEEPGVRIPTGLVDCTYEQVRCGIPMEVVFRPVTPDLTLPYFRPTVSS